MNVFCCWSIQSATIYCSAFLLLIATCLHTSNCEWQTSQKGDVVPIVRFWSVPDDADLYEIRALKERKSDFISRAQLASGSAKQEFEKVVSECARKLKSLEATGSFGISPEYADSRDSALLLGMVIPSMLVTAALILSVNPWSLGTFFQNSKSEIAQPEKNQKVDSKGPVDST